MAKSKNLIFLEAIKTAFVPAFTKIIEELKDGIIGEIKEVRSTFTKLVEDKNSREWNTIYGGATNELASYSLLLAQKLLPQASSTTFYDNVDNSVDAANTIISTHHDGSLSISTVGIGMKSEGCAVVSGTKGYLYIPAPWWLTKDFYIRYEDPNKEVSFHYNFEGDGLRYEISEFISLIHRNQIESMRLTYKDMIEINKVISAYNKYRINKDFQ
jgi:predicted dehydrogenase